MVNKAVGLGNSSASIIFYIKNRPPLDIYQNLNIVKPLMPGEISHICQETGNHWRKIFNVYAKLIFELSPHEFSTWQKLRDELLLQKHSEHCLLFSAPNLTTNLTANLTANSASIPHQTSDANTAQAPYFTSTNPRIKLHIVLGKGYAEHLNLCSDSIWLSHDFAINHKLGLIICPYFDYRQLSNIKITQLAGLIQQHAPPLV